MGCRVPKTVAPWAMETAFKSKSYWIIVMILNAWSLGRLFVQMKNLCTFLHLGCPSCAQDDEQKLALDAAKTSAKAMSKKLIDLP